MTSQSTEPMRGRDLRQRRVDARVSQTALAEALGMNRTVLSLIENEHAPSDAAFTARYLDALEALTTGVPSERPVVAP